MPSRSSNSATEDASVKSWHVLIYRVPSEPTRHRATVWRRLKGLGAVYLQNSVAALPASANAERSLRKLRHEITEMSGTAVLMLSTVLVGESTVLAVYQEARRDEFEEITDRCADFLVGLEKEYVAKHFTYGELEENEVDLTKLHSWFEKILIRDEFKAPGRSEAEAALEKCDQALEAYAVRVYAEEPDAH
jgi:DNA-binding transcriptional regulator PaaX